MEIGFELPTICSNTMSLEVCFGHSKFITLTQILFIYVSDYNDNSILPLTRYKPIAVITSFTKNNFSFSVTCFFHDLFWKQLLFKEAFSDTAGSICLMCYLIQLFP